MSIQYMYPNVNNWETNGIPSIGSANDAWQLIDEGTVNNSNDYIYNTESFYVQYLDTPLVFPEKIFCNLRSNLWANYNNPSEIITAQTFITLEDSIGNIISKNYFIPESPNYTGDHTYQIELSNNPNFEWYDDITISIALSKFENYIYPLDSVLYSTEILLSGTDLIGYSKGINLFLKQIPPTPVDTPTGIPLYTRGLDIINSGLPLFINGGTDSHLNLYIDGYGEEVLSDLSLYLQCNETLPESGFVPLHLPSYLLNNTGLNLYIRGGGIDESNNSLPLFLEQGSISGSLNLFLQAYDPLWLSKDRSLNFTMQAAEYPIHYNSLDLYMNGDADWYMNLFIPGLDRLTEELNLYVSGGYPRANVPFFMDTQAPATTDINFNIKSTVPASGDLDFYIRGGSASHIPLYVSGPQGVEISSGTNLSIWCTEHSGVFNSIDFYLNGDRISSGVMNFSITGSPSINDYSSQLNMFLNTIGNPDGTITQSASTQFLVYNNWNASNKSVNLFTQANIQEASGLLNLFLNREAEGTYNNTNLSILGPDGYNNMVDLYLNGTPNYRDNISLHISGVATTEDYIRLYIHGY